MPPVAPSTPKKLRILAIVGILVVIVVGIAGYIWHSKQGNTVYVMAREFAPKGKIYLTLAPKQGTTTGIYTYDIGSKTLATAYAPTNHVSMTAKVIDASTLLLATNENSSIVQINKLDTTNNKLTQLTQSNLSLKRHPAYSAALSLFVFGAKEKHTTTVGTIDEFNIYSVTPDGIEKKITQGAMPNLTPDGKSAVVLRKDGLYLVNLTNASVKNIWPLDLGSAWLNAQFTVSPSGKYIAWSMPYEGYLYIMQVDSWNSFQGHIAFKVPAHAFWPVFSPNEEYLAYEQVDWNTPNPNPRLVITDLVTPQSVVVQDLSAFDQQRMFISDWK